jgi:hypothetical protein
VFVSTSPRSLGYHSLTAWLSLAQLGTIKLVSLTGTSSQNPIIIHSSYSGSRGCGTLFWFYQFSPCFPRKLEDVTHVNTAVRKMPWTTLQSLRRRRDARWNRKFVEPPVVLAARGGGSFCMLSILLEALKDHCSDITMFKLGIGWVVLRAKNAYYYNISRTLYAPCFVLSHWHMAQHHLGDRPP